MTARLAQHVNVVLREVGQAFRTFGGRRRYLSAAVLAVAFALGVTASRVGRSGQIVVEPSARVSARATGQVKVISSSGRLISSRSVPSTRVGYGSDVSRITRDQVNKLTAVVLSSKLPGANPALSRSALRDLAKTAPDQPLAYLAEISSAASDRESRVGPTGIDSLVSSADGKTLTMIKYGVPGQPDTLMTLQQEGRLVMAYHATWKRVQGGDVLKSAEIDEFLPNGIHRQVAATLDDYAVTHVALRDSESEGDQADAAPASGCFPSSGYTTSGHYWHTSYCGSSTIYYYGPGPHTGYCLSFARALAYWSARFYWDSFQVDKYCNLDSPYHDSTICAAWQATMAYDEIEFAYAAAAYAATDCRPF